MRIRFLSVLALLLLLTSVVHAQNTTRSTVGTITASGQIVQLTTNATGNGSFQVTGTWTGTLVFETSNDNSTWVALTVTPMPVSTVATSTTANGVWTYSGAFQQVRVRASAAITGTATVQILATAARAGGGGGTAGPAGPGTTIGAAVTGGTPDAQLYIDAAGNLAQTGVATNGQLLCGDTGNIPQLCTITAGSNITVTNAPHSITIAATGSGTPGGSTTQLQYNNAGAFGGITGATTNGTAVTLTSPTLVTPALGTPASGVLTNATGLPLTTGVTGNLPVTNLNSGTSASSSTFWRGDGTWATPAGAGTVTSSGTPLIHQVPVFTTATNIQGIAVGATGTYFRGVSAGDPIWSTLLLPNAATTGDLFIATSTNTMGVLSDVAVGAYLRSGGTGTAPLWSTLLLPNAATTNDVPFSSATNTWGYDTGLFTYTVGTGVLKAPILSAGGGSSGKLTLTNVGGAGFSFIETVGDPAADVNVTPPVALPASNGMPRVATTAGVESWADLTRLGTVTTGVWNGTTIAVANGGTGLTAGTSGGLLAYTATGTLASSAALTANAPVLGGGAGVVPKTVAGITTDGTSKVTLGVAGTSVGSVDFKNATSGTVTIAPTTGALGTVTMTLPAANSNPVIPDTGASNNFLTAISAGGVITKAQPAFSNLSGSATCAQLPALTGDVTTSAGSCATTVGTLAVSKGGTGTASTLTGLVRGSASAMTAAELSGDVTTSGSNAVTIASAAVTAAKSAAVMTARGIVLEVGSPTGSALTTSDAAYVTVPFKCTISASDVMIDAADATVTFDIFRAATGGTALPTSSILTGGFLGVSTGTAVHNANTTLFASTAIAANDRLGLKVHAANTAKYASVMLQCNATD